MRWRRLNPRDALVIVTICICETGVGSLSLISVAGFCRPFRATVRSGRDPGWRAKRAYPRLLSVTPSA